MMDSVSRSSENSRAIWWALLLVGDALGAVLVGAAVGPAVVGRGVGDALVGAGDAPVVPSSNVTSTK